MDINGGHHEFTFLDIDTQSHLNETLYYRLTFGSSSLILHLTDLQPKTYVDDLVVRLADEDEFFLSDIGHCLREGYVRVEKNSIVMVNVCNGMVTK